MVVIVLSLVGYFVLGGISGPDTFVQNIKRVFIQDSGNVNVSGIEGHFNISASVTGTLNCAADGDSVFVAWEGIGETEDTLATVKSDWDLLGITYTLSAPELLGEIGETIWVTISVPVIPISFTQAFLLGEVFSLFDFGLVFNCP